MVYTTTCHSIPKVDRTKHITHPAPVSSGLPRDTQIFPNKQAMPAVYIYVVVVSTREYLEKKQVSIYV